MKENPKSKGVAALIVSKMGKESDGEGEGYEGEEDQEGLDVAAEDVLRAVEEKDPAALKAALKSFWEMC